MALGFVSTAVLETPTGFAFFSVYEAAFNGPVSLWSWFIRRSFATKVISLREFKKVDHKSVVLDDGPGKRLADTIRKCCSDGRQLIVGNEDLRDAIKSKLKIDCFDDKEVIHELMWGLRNVLYDYVRRERCNITREYLLPLSKGLRDCMDKYEINIPTEAVDRNIIILIGLVDRCDTRLKHSAKTICEIGDKLVPDIGSLIKDDRLYAEAMAKILTPVFLEEWRPTEWFEADVLKMIDAAEAASGDARRKVDFTMYCEIKDCLVKLRLLPEGRTRFLKEVKSLADNFSRPSKRSYTEVAEGPSGNCFDGLPRGNKFDGGEALD